MERIIPLQTRINNIDKIIDKYTVLIKNTDSNGIKKNYKFFVDHLIKQKIDIQELIAEIKESGLTNLEIL